MLGSGSLIDYSIDLARRLRMLEVASKVTNEKIDRLLKEVKEIPKLKVELKDQALLHINQYIIDLSILVSEILKWSIGTQTQPHGDGCQFCTTSNQRMLRYVNFLHTDLMIFLMKYYMFLTMFLVANWCSRFTKNTFEQQGFGCVSDSSEEWSSSFQFY